MDSYIGNETIENIGIHKCKFTVMFDEVDQPANLNNACEFIDYSKEFLCIDSIHLITATPYHDFWNKMKERGVNQLKNLRYEINEIPSPEETEVEI